MTIQQIISTHLVGKKITIYEREVIGGEYKGKLVGYYFDKGRDNEFFKFNPINGTIKSVDFDDKEERKHYGDVIVLLVESTDGEVIKMSAYDYTNLEIQ
jgi:hypothetical protein